MGEPGGDGGTARGKGAGKGAGSGRKDGQGPAAARGKQEAGPQARPPAHEGEMKMKRGEMELQPQAHRFDKMYREGRRWVWGGCGQGASIPPPDVIQRPPGEVAAG